MVEFRSENIEGVCDFLVGTAEQVRNNCRPQVSWKSRRRRTWWTRLNPLHGCYRSWDHQAPCGAVVKCRDASMGSEAGEGKAEPPPCLV
jgi:hypothetical protein